jgi:hypothetical protein
MKKKCFIILFAIVGLIVSCERENSEDVNQDRIFTEYELYYNANEDKTYATARFRFGNALGTLLELTSPSEVRFNGDLLSFKSGLVYYEKQYAGFVSNGTFSWKDTDGVEFTNVVSINTIDYPSTLDTIPRTAAFELFWVGDSLSAGETVILTANGIIVGDLQIFTQNNINSKSVILPLNQLQALGQGMGTLWFDRIFNQDLQQKTSTGGVLKGKYRPINKQVYFD